MSRSSRSRPSLSESAELARVLALSKREAEEKVKTPKSKGKAASRSRSKSAARPSKTAVPASPASSSSSSKSSATPKSKRSASRKPAAKKTEHVNNNTVVEAGKDRVSALTVAKEPYCHVLIAFFSWLALIVAFAYGVLITVEPTVKDTVEQHASQYWNIALEFLLSPAGKAASEGASPQ